MTTKQRAYLKGLAMTIEPIFRKIELPKAAKKQTI